MKWNSLLAIMGLIVVPELIGTGAAFAQRLPAAESPDASSSASYHASFFAPSGVVRFELIQGRLCLDPHRHRKGAQSRQRNGVAESITVTADRGIPSLHYVYRSPQRQLTLSVHRSRSVRAESWLAADNSRLVLVQPAQGAVQLSVQRGDLRDLHTGSTLIHVRQGDSFSFDQHFGELVHCLLRGQSLAEISDRAEQKAFENFGNSCSYARQSVDRSHSPAAGDIGHVPNQAEIAEQVNRLRSPRRSERAIAERMLLSWGTSILPTLQSLTREDLDAEQRARVAAMIDKLRPRVGDTPASLAKLLTNDRAYWLLVSPRLSDGQLQLANRYFQRNGIEAIRLTEEPTERIATAREQ